MKALEDKALTASKLENHMVINIEAAQKIDTVNTLQCALEAARRREEIVTELAGRMDDAATELAEAGGDTGLIERFVEYLDKLQAKYEAEGEVIDRELALLCPDWR